MQAQPKSIEARVVATTPVAGGRSFRVEIELTFEDHRNQSLKLLKLQAALSQDFSSPLVDEPFDIGLTQHMLQVELTADQLMRSHTIFCRFFASNHGGAAYGKTTNIVVVPGLIAILMPCDCDCHYHALYLVRLATSFPIHVIERGKWQLTARPAS